MNRSILLLVSLALAAIPTAASADSVQDMLRKLPPPAFTSKHNMDALEYCIGVGVSEPYMPTVLRGEDRRLIYGGIMGGAAIGFLVAIVDTGEERTLAVRSYKGDNEKIDRAIRACL